MFFRAYVKTRYSRESFSVTVRDYLRLLGDDAELWTTDFPESPDRLRCLPIANRGA